jgi:hypothetical protein
LWLKLQRGAPAIGFQRFIMSNRHTRIRRKTAAKKRPRWHVIILYGVLICLGLGILILGRGALERRSGSAPDRNARPRQAKPAATTPQRAAATKDSASPMATSTLIDDDGKTLWTSPTDGPPIEVKYLPPGVTFVLAVRPESLSEHPEGDKIIEAANVWVSRAREQLERDLPGIPSIERALVGWSVDSKGNWTSSAVVHLSDSRTAGNYLAAKLPKAATRKHGDVSYKVQSDRAYFVPAGSANAIVVAAPEVITEIIELAGNPPPLRRDVERLLAHTDMDRQVTMICAPNSLFSEGRSLFEGEIPRLRGPLYWFLGDELSAVALSLHWDENFFYEIMATPTLETSPERAARILSERLQETPEKVKQYVGTLHAKEYGREVVSRFPAMIEKLAEFSRSGFDKDHAVLRGYLPAVAGHNLLLGAELTLAEAPGGARPVAGATSPSAGDTHDVGSVNERLKKATSLRFGRETLEAALDQLSKDVGVAIAIRGADLQADGITKNQQFGIDVADKPAEEILVEILRLANPDKTATSARDPKQKLVYVIIPGDNGVEQIVVTTRAAAAARGDELPDAFR